jgi:L-cysteate sulfo-lyase
MSARVDLGVWRTPIEPAPRLAKQLGLRSGDLWIKHEDWIGFGGGGNKLRKLEFLCAQAIAEGATWLLTTGAAQSNYARLTAASARRLGLEVTLVLRGDGVEAGTGNLSLDELLGADIRWAGVTSIAELDEVAQEAADALRSRGERPAILPYGGSNATGAQGYLECGRELLEQAPDAEHVVVAVGSGGTMAGLVGALGAQRVLGVDTGAVPDARERVARILEGLAERDSRAPAAHAQQLRLSSDEIGEGYERLTDRARLAMEYAARCEGLILDPVYTAKAMAGVASAVSRGDIRPGERTVFVHTGGLPGLFGHPVAAELAERRFLPTP